MMPLKGDLLGCFGGFHPGPFFTKTVLMTTGAQWASVTGIGNERYLENQTLNLQRHSWVRQNTLPCLERPTEPPPRLATRRAQSPASLRLWRLSSVCVCGTKSRPHIPVANVIVRIFICGVTSHKPTSKPHSNFDIVVFLWFFWELWCPVVSVTVGFLVHRVGLWVCRSSGHIVFHRVFAERGDWPCFKE